MTIALNSNYNTIHYLKMADNKRWDDLIEFIKYLKKKNPYNKHNDLDSYTMWKEQCVINFPILYLASVYLYIYAIKRNCNTFLFATRDCCHWYKIFKQLFPDMNCHYFHCSRNMFENAIQTHNSHFKNYVKSVHTDIDKTVYIDIHGTGKHMFTYFDKEFDNSPYCFLLSARYPSYKTFPYMVEKYIRKEKIKNLVFGAKGSPIEMLNYDCVGTLQNYSSNGPVRDNLEYKFKLIKPYHTSIDFIVDKLKYFIDENNYVTKFCKNNLDNLCILIDKVFKCIKINKPIVGQYIQHIGKHIKSDLCHEKLNENIQFKKILSNETTYGLIWEGSYNQNPCIIKMVLLSSGKCYNEKNKKYFEQNDKPPFLHKEFKSLKPMDVKKFEYEVKQIKHLSKFNLAPKIYSTSVCDDNSDIHYGFIVMEKMDNSLKQVLLKRSLGSKEKYIIEKIINTLHHKGIVHGDMKPSNIGVDVDSKGYIRRAVFFDCAKVKHKKNYNSNLFEKWTKRDWDVFKKHCDKNKNENMHH